MHARRITTIVVAATAALLLAQPSALAFNSYAGTFRDEDGNVHEENIEPFASEGITDGCNPPTNDRFCPDEDVTRGQMAKFLDRTLDVADDGVLNESNDDDDTDEDFFTDDEDSVFESSINRIAAADITDGCNPPTNDEYCPEDFVTRGQMAKFLVRTFDLPPSDTDYFDDDEDSIFEADINALREAKITLGCNPPENDNFCPQDNVNRDQMASFIARGLDLEPNDPTPFDNETCDPAYRPCVPTFDEVGDLDCDRILEEYPEGVDFDDDFDDVHEINQDDDDMACEAGDPALVNNA
jgi:hypothetical protein